MIRRSWWLLPGAAAAVLAFLVLVVLPPDRSIDNLAEWAFRIAPVVLAVLAIAGFPRRPAVGVVLMVVLIVGYMGVLDTLNIMRIMQFAQSGDQGAAFPRLYQFTTFIDAFTVLAVLFGYRLGGGSTGRVLRIGLAGALVLVSGLNDLTFYYAWDWPAGRPAKLDWASHIKVFIGHMPTPGEAIAFCAVHLVLAALILAWPALRRFRGRGRRPAGDDVATPEVTPGTPAAAGRR